MERISLNQNLNLKVHGRISNKEVGGIPLFWTASCLELNVTGSELWLEYEHASGYFESYIRIEVDGFDFMRFMLEDGCHKVHILRRFDKKKVKNLRIYREDQASPNKVLLTAIETDGELMPVKEKDLKIEFVGDSVTSGEGLVCTPEMQVWTPAVFGSRGLYALEVAKQLDADWSVMSQSGWGMHCEWSNDIHHNMPDYYEYVASTNQGVYIEALGGLELYDFKTPAQVTVINLGSNDASAFGKPPYIDENGQQHQLRLDENGEPNKEDMQMLSDCTYAFFEKIHRYNPETAIICCYGMIKDTINGAICGAVEKYNREHNDKKVYALELPKFSAEYHGSRMHPGPICHKAYAEKIVEKIKEIL